MPTEIKDLDGGLGNLITGYGILTGKEYRNAIKKHFSQNAEKFNKYRYSLCDYTKVTRLELDSNDINIVAGLCREASEVNPNVVVALIADKDITFGMSRMWDILFNENNWEVMVFRDREEAEEWIRIKVKEKFGIDNLTID